MTNKQKIFLDMFDPLRDNLWRFCLSMTRNRDQAKDLLQETIAGAYSAFDSLTHTGAFLSFLFTIASRQYQKISVRTNGKVPLDEWDCSSLVSDTVSPETLTDITLMYRALDQLPADQKTAIVLFDLMGYSQVEVATIQDCSLDALKKRLYRGRKQLAELLGANDDISDDIDIPVHPILGEVTK